MKTVVKMLFHAVLNLSPSCRCDSVGDDVLRGRAVHFDASTGRFWSAGEGRASVPASNLHYWCLYGYGQVWVPVFQSFFHIWSELQHSSRITNTCFLAMLACCEGKPVLVSAVHQTEISQQASMDCDKLLYRHLWCSDNESYWLWPPGLPSSTTLRVV